MECKEPASLKRHFSPFAWKTRTKIKEMKNGPYHGPIWRRASCVRTRRDRGAVVHSRSPDPRIAQCAKRMARLAGSAAGSLAAAPVTFADPEQRDFFLNSFSLDSMSSEKKNTLPRTPPPPAPPVNKRDFLNGFLPCASASCLCLAPQPCASASCLSLVPQPRALASSLGRV